VTSSLPVAFAAINKVLLFVVLSSDQRVAKSSPADICGVSLLEEASNHTPYREDELDTVPFNEINDVFLDRS